MHCFQGALCLDTAMPTLKLGCGSCGLAWVSLEALFLSKIYVEIFVYFVGWWSLRGGEEG